MIECSGLVFGGNLMADDSSDKASDSGIEHIEERAMDRIGVLERAATRYVIEIFGMVAVVLSLLMLAYEVRQSNRIAKATTTYEIGRDVNQFNELGYSDPAFAALLIKLQDPDFAASGAESLQVRLLAHRFINVWTVQEAAYQNGLLTEAQFSATKADVITVMEAFPHLNKHWKEVLRVQPGLKDSAVLAPIVEANVTDK